MKMILPVNEYQLLKIIFHQDKNFTSQFTNFTSTQRRSNSSINGKLPQNYFDPRLTQELFTNICNSSSTDTQILQVLPFTIPTAPNVNIISRTTVKPTSVQLVQFFEPSAFRPQFTNEVERKEFFPEFRKTQAAVNVVFWHARGPQ